jgi:small-conductance mechanosensitive channel
LRGGLIDKQLQKSDEISPALSALISKVLGVLLPVLALLIALQMTGFNLATLAIFSGAVGIGVGLGLQKTVSNFAAGFTLLADKSIKPGDAIEVDGQFGWVTGMQSRYVSIRTRDGTEMLLPNDHFINNGVTNWSKSDISCACTRRSACPTARATSRRCRPWRSRRPRPWTGWSPSKRAGLQCDGVWRLLGEFRPALLDSRSPERPVECALGRLSRAMGQACMRPGIEIPFPQMDLHVKALPDRS